jgi:preprotein translocase SecE subunit
VSDSRLENENEKKRTKMELNPAVWISDGRQFASEVRAEYRKVTWPTQQEATAGTIGVLLVTFVLTLGLSIVDFVLAQAIRLITS